MSGRVATILLPLIVPYLWCSIVKVVVVAVADTVKYQVFLAIDHNTSLYQGINSYKIRSAEFGTNFKEKTRASILTTLPTISLIFLQPLIAPRR